MYLTTGACLISLRASISAFGSAALGGRGGGVRLRPGFCVTRNPG